MKTRLRARWRSTDSYIKIGLAATFLFLLFVVAASFGTATNDAGKAVVRWRAFMNSLPNEMGDALAGTFSGLAFLWIIVTVLIQGKELRLQRKELSMTRSELSGQREASQEMAKTMKAQALTMETQLGLLAAEREARSYVDAGKLLDQCELTFKRSIKLLSTLNTKNPMHWSGHSSSPEYLLYFRNSEVFEERFAGDLDGILSELKSRLQDLRRNNAAGMMVNQPTDQSPIVNALDVIEGTFKLEPKLAPWDQARLHRLELLDWQATLTAVKDEASLWGAAS